MKIALVSPYDLAIAGGVNSNIHPLAYHLRMMGHDVWIVGPANNRVAIPDPNHTIVLGFTRPIPAGGSTANLAVSTSFYKDIKQVLKEEKFDLIHVNDPLVVGYGMQFLRYANDATCVSTFHAARAKVPFLYKFLKKLMWDFVVRIDARIAVSTAARDCLEPVFPGHYNIVPNGVDYQRFAGPSEKIPWLDDGMINIQFVGRITEERKGFIYLLQAFARLKRHNPKVRLVVIGKYSEDDPKKKKFDRFIAEENIQDVVFTNYVEDVDLPRYFHSAHIFCAPNTGNESQGIILLEAMAAGLPIVASGIDGFSNVITQNVEGILVAPKDEFALFLTLDQLVGDEMSRYRKGKAGFQEARRYDWPLIAARVMEVYHQAYGHRMRQISQERVETASRLPSHWRRILAKAKGGIRKLTT